MYIYTHTCDVMSPSLDAYVTHGCGIRPVSITRLPSFRTQPLENISVDSVKTWIPEQPSPWRKS